MDTFEFDLPKKRLDGSRAIFKGNEFLLALLAERMRDSKMTRKKLADILEVDKSTVTKLLRGNQNLTLRTIGEIAGALDFDVEFQSSDRRALAGNTPPASPSLSQKPKATSATGGGNPSMMGIFVLEKSSANQSTEAR